MSGPSALVGTTLLGRYVIRGILGQGGMGVVYAAKHLPTGRNVALKILTAALANQRKSALRRFQREARTASLVGRPHVAEILEAGTLETGEAFIAMEQLTGETLRQRLDRSLRLEFADIASTFTQLLTALSAVHSRGLVHRDIKPDNIFFSRAGDGPPVIKLIDFGVVKLTDPISGGGDDDAPITHTGIVVGTPAYVSPEQILSPKAVDGRADLWAVGVCLYEAVTGRLPFIASAAPLVMLEILHATQAPARTLRPDCPPALEALVQRALEKVPDKRFPDALTFRRAILAFWSEHRTVFQKPKRPKRDDDDDEDTEPSSEVALPIVDLAKFADLTPIPTTSPTPRGGRPRPRAPERRTPQRGSKSTAPPPGMTPRVDPRVDPHSPVRSIERLALIDTGDDDD